METNQNELEKTIGLRQNKADQLLKDSYSHHKKYKLHTKRATLLLCVGMLLVIGVAVLKMPLMNGAPIFDIGNLFTSILLFCGALINLVAFVMVQRAKKHYIEALRKLILRGDIPNVTPLWVKMM